MIKFSLVMLLGAVALTATLPAADSFAGVTFEVVCDGAGYDVSADGSVVVGYTEGDFDVFRWTADTGVVALPQNPYPVFGNSAGTPAVSADGTRVSATILGADSTYITQGVWTVDQGWQETMPPTPPGGGIIDHAYGSCWGLSGDGTTVVGLYWRPGQPDGGAHASAWTAQTGAVGLGSSGASSRANSVNHDGSVVVGWDQVVGGSAWRPAVWVDGELSILCSNDQSGQAEASTPDGLTLVGYERNDATHTKTPARWRWNGTGYGPTEFLGLLPGTGPDAATVKAEDVSGDGSIVVGYCSFYGDPFYTTGFIWTEAEGIIDVEDFLAEHGILVPTSLDIVTLSAISEDGNTLLGSAVQTVPPYHRQSFLIHLDATVGIAFVAAPPLSLARIRAWPNPMHGATTLSIELPSSATGSLRFYDSSGRLVRELLGGAVGAGHHRVTWDGRNGMGERVAAGVYYCRFQAGAMRATRNLVVIR